ncbi:MAG TPA: hypothetical protein VNZ58_11995 [Thermomicrobiales bacterium]|nr:hypothetical protein [Thermomicrobiales bacterium]
MSTPGPSPFTFGIYASSQVGAFTGKPDDTDAMLVAIEELQGPRPFIVREYIHFRGDVEAPIPSLAFPDTVYARPDILLDLVLCYLPPEENIEGWLAFVRNAIDRYGHLVRFLQVTLEPNFNHPGIDGSSPGIRDALIHGMGEARRYLDDGHYGEVEIGFSVAEPQEWAGGDGDFWPDVAKRGGQTFINALDYVGLGLYPDAFSPVAPPGAPGDLASLTTHALDTLRNDSMAAAGIPATVPIHIAESGSPTGLDRSQAAQASSLQTIVESVLDHRSRFNISAFELFGLRDTDSENPDPFHQFGIMTDTYTPKQAFETYRNLITTSS